MAASENQRTEEGRDSAKVGDTLNRNLPTQTPQFRADARVDTMREVTG
jgi:hypothetical protein